MLCAKAHREQIELLELDKPGSICDGSLRHDSAGIAIAENNSIDRSK